MHTYKNAVLAVYVCGSTVKKLDRPYSDLEMVCVIRDDTEIPNKYYVYEGLLVEIGYHQESEYLKAARDPSWDWPLKADQYRNRLVLFEHDNWMRKLDQAVRENEQADFTETTRIQVLAMTESLAAVRNAELRKDRLDLRTRAFYLAWDTAKVVFLLNRKYVLTTSWFWKQLFECKEQPKEFRKLIEIVAGFVESTGDQVTNAAEALWRETMVMVRKHGITIESRQIIV